MVTFGFPLGNVFNSPNLGQVPLPSLVGTLSSEPLLSLRQTVGGGGVFLSPIAMEGVFKNPQIFPSAHVSSSNLQRLSLSSWEPGRQLCELCTGRNTGAGSLKYNSMRAGAGQEDHRASICSPWQRRLINSTTKDQVFTSSGFREPSQWGAQRR